MVSKDCNEKRMKKGLTVVGLLALTEECLDELKGKLKKYGGKEQLEFKDHEVAQFLKDYEDMIKIRRVYSMCRWLMKGIGVPEEMTRPYDRDYISINKIDEALSVWRLTPRGLSIE